MSLLIIETFKYMHLIPFISNNYLDLTFSYMTMLEEIDWVTYQASAHRSWFSTRGTSKNPLSAPIIAPLFHLISRSFIPLPLSGHWVDLFAGLHLISWEKGLKAQKVKSSW